MGRGKTWVYASVATGTFPRPTHLGRNVCWSEREIQRWIADRLAERDTSCTGDDPSSSRS